MCSSDLLDRLSERQPVFLNLTKPLILSDMLALIEPRAAVLEIREDVTLDDDVLKACERLHGQGYALALDDFIEGSDAEALLPFARYVKVDVLQTSPAQASAIAQRLQKLGIQLVAEKVESRDLYDKTQQDGYSLFQGYYFCRPKTLTTRTIPAPQLAYLRLISALRRPDLSMAELEALVKQDTSLSLRVLRLVNSAAFALHRRVDSVREALVLVGQRTIASWVSVWAMAGLNAAPSEVATMAMMRARMCEVLGDAIDGSGDRLFLLGLCSLLETMLGTPMAHALEHLPLADDIHAALLGADSPGRSLLDTVIAYERGDWLRAELLAADLKLPPSALAGAYAEALHWTGALTTEQRIAA